MVEKHIIRTSDRGMFKSCRQFWDFTSKIRMDYEPNRTPHYFEFGTAIHNGLETYYKPELWRSPRDVVEQMALADFLRTNKEQADKMAKTYSNNVLDPEKKEEYEDRAELGVGMLEGYFGYAQEVDDFIPLYSEIEFEVPLVVPQSILTVRPGFEVVHNGELDLPVLYYDGAPVVYQGRIDLVVEMSDGSYWIYDHKTAARFEDTEWVDKDAQVSSYCWALGIMGVQVEGFVMNQIKKKAATKPRLLDSPRKGRALSVSKSQGTTYELYKKAIKEHGENPAMYEDILTYLKAQGPEEFFRRLRTYRTPAQIEYAGRMTVFEAMDMLGDPFIYPNASMWNCRGCAFATPCLQRTEGTDWQFTLDNPGLFKKRSA